MLGSTQVQFQSERKWIAGISRRKAEKPKGGGGGGEPASEQVWSKGVREEVTGDQTCSKNQHEVLRRAQGSGLSHWYSGLSPAWAV